MVSPNFILESKLPIQEIETRMKLSLIYQRGHVTTASSARAVITMNGMEHHLFRSINTNTRAYGTLWDDSESRSYKFYTTIDGNVFTTDPEKGMVLKVEGTIDDTFTTADEIKSYITEVVSMTGVKDLMVKFPFHDPEVKCSDYRLNAWARNPRRNGPRGRVNNNCYKQRDKAYYGKTKFFYRLNFTRKQLEKFANYDESKMWGVLEAAFGVKPGTWGSKGRRLGRNFLNSYATLLNAPLSLLDLNLKNGSNLIAARKFYMRWKKLKTIDDLETLVKTAAKLFNTNFHSFNFLKVIKLTLEGEEVSYFVNASAERLFGNISRSGKVVENVDTISGRAAQIIDFDRVSSRINHNPQAIIKNLNIKQNPKDLDKIIIDFDLPEKPEFVFFRIDRTNNWKAYKSLGKYILINKDGNFVKGHNKIIIDRKGQDRISKEMSKKIFASKYVTFMLATSMGEKGWGSVFSERIKIKISDEEKEKRKAAKKQSRDKNNECNHETEGNLMLPCSGPQ